MKQILTCTDGSVYATSVYDHTAWAALRLDAGVRVLHMLERGAGRAETTDFSGNLGPDTGKELLSEFVQLEETRNRLARERGKVILEGARQHLAKVGVTNVSVEQQHGELVESVTRMEAAVDLVVVGKRGEAADFAKMHLGSNLERVIRASIRPVLVASRKFEPVRRILIAYDGGPSVEKALRFAMEQPLLKGLSCLLLRAGKIDDKAEWYLNEAAGKLREAGYDVDARATPGDPESVISAAVREESVDLLVMGAYGHSRIRHLMIGSTTTAMVRTCRVPVLMFR
ncbi:MAG: universal stress protein [Opitutales bacterium]|nr:universal stress protein [Opitutales bacterium]